MTEAQLLNDLNRTYRLAERPGWWTVRHLDVTIRLPLRRTAANEVQAREFFMSIAQDPLLRRKRAGVLTQWGRFK